MGNQQNSIVLNGKIYDAVSGALIHDAKPAVHQTASKPKPQVHRKTGLVMDGVKHKPLNAHSRKHAHKHRHTASKTKNHTAKAHPPHKTTPKKPEPHEPEHTVRHARRHQPQKSATLMRHAVKKPTHHNDHKDKKHEEPTNMYDERTQKRLERARAVEKSHHINRFPSGHHSSASRTAHSSPSKPATKTVHAPLPVEAAPKQSPPTTPSMSESEKLVTNALKHARAHEAHKPYAKKPRKRHVAHALGVSRRAANLAMGALAVLLLGGFFLYQNIPNLSMQLASTRAGFDAELPGYRPAGFTQDSKVAYSPGKVTISFHSNSDDREYTLTQQVSNWNSEALADNYLAANDRQYQSYDAAGKTVYVYDNSSATWVNGGIWYQIEGNSSLTSDQLINIANSI